MINTIAYACPATNTAANTDVYGVYKGAQTTVDNPYIYIILAPDAACYIVTYYPKGIFTNMLKTTYEMRGDDILITGGNFSIFAFKTQDKQLTYKTYDNEGNAIKAVYEKQDISIDDFMKSVLESYNN